jgi:hypothetical protein
MSSLNLEPLDVITCKKVSKHFKNSDVLAQANFGPPKGKVFVAILLTAVDPKRIHEFDLKATLEKLGVCIHETVGGQFPELHQKKAEKR